MTTDYFFDSYAIIEILKASENYRIYLDSEFITTKLNIFEVYYHLLKQSKEKADIFLKKFILKTVDFDGVVIEEACKLKAEKKNLSMADCIGYVVALKAGTRFLTGDGEFEHMKNVEFVR